MRIRFLLFASVATVALTAFFGGCSGEFAGAPAGESKRKAEVEAGHAGAASIEELRKAYEAAHRKKDFKALDDLYGADLGLPKWMARGGLNPTQRAMREITKYPIRAVEFEPGPPREVGRKGEVSYRRGRQTDHVIGDTRGKLIFVMASGERLDPSFVVLNYYGRFFIEPAELVVEDAVKHLKTGRPCQYVALPMDGTQRRRDPQSPGDVIGR